MRRIAVERQPVYNLTVEGEPEFFANGILVHNSWGRALNTLAGPVVSIPGPLWHLWHPHAAPGARGAVYPESIALLRAYERADEVPRLMRAVVARVPPEALVAVDPPVEYRSASPVVRAARRNVYFPDGRAVVSDPDVVEVLDRTPGVTRVAVPAVP